MIRWLTIKEYQQATGLSRCKIKSMMDAEQITWETTDGGGKFLIKHEVPDDMNALLNKIISLETTVTKLCSHLGLRV